MQAIISITLLSTAWAVTLYSMYETYQGLNYQYQINPDNVITNTTSVAPFLVMDILDPSQFVSVTFNNVPTPTIGALTGVLISSAFPLSIRVDSRFQLSLVQQLKPLDMSSATEALGLVIYVHRQSSNTDLRAVIAYQEKNGLVTNRCPVSNRMPLNLSGITGTFFCQSATYLLCLLTGYIAPDPINVTHFVHYLKNTGYFQSSDYIYKIGFSNRFSGKGKYQFSFNHILDTQKDVYLKRNQTIKASFPVFNDLYQLNLSSTDYGNLTVSKTIANLSGISCSCKYSGVSTNLKAYQHISIGYLNQTWITPPNSYLLPINLSQKYTVNFNWSFTDLTSDANSLRSACIAAVIRNDYDQVGQLFSGIQEPSAEIYICALWSSPLIPIGTNVASFSDITGSYTVYKANPSGWPSYTFVPTSNKMSLTVNIYPFIEFIQGNLNELSSGHIAALEAGFRVYSGTTRFDFIDLSLNVALSPTPLTPPLPFPIAPRTPPPAPMDNCQIVDSSSDIHKCLVDQQAQKWILYLISFPNIGLLLRVSPFIIFLDEFSYYKYHAATYDRSFVIISRLFWNWTNEKWVPIFLDDLYGEYSENISNWVSLSQNPQTVPDRFARFEQNCLFMDNTQDFWFVTVPLTVITFLILKGAYWCIRKRKISKVLKPFCSVGNLAMSLIGDNIVYLSFRSFQQILYSEPQLNLKFWISHLLCLLTLFWVLFCAGAMPTVLLRYRRREFDNDFFHKSVQSTFLYSYILISRVLIGAIHSIISTPLWQITCLLLLHSLTLTLYSKNTQLFKQKYTAALMITQAIIRVILLSFLFSEVFFKEQIIVPPLIEALFCWLSVDMIGLIIFSMLSIYFNNLIVEFILMLLSKLNKKPNAPSNCITTGQAHTRKKKIVKIKLDTPKESIQIKKAQEIVLKKAPVSEALSQIMMNQTTNFTGRNFKWTPKRMK